MRFAIFGQRLSSAFDVFLFPQVDVKTANVDDAWWGNLTLGNIPTKGSWIDLEFLGGLVSGESYNVWTTVADGLGGVKRVFRWIPVFISPPVSTAEGGCGRHDFRSSYFSRVRV